jgi:hypothetical protein
MNGSGIMKEDDWRLQGQEKYLQGFALYFRQYLGNDHDHCEFCLAKFMNEPGEDIRTEGYTTKDYYRWICSSCFNDFKDRMNWKVISD